MLQRGQGNDALHTALIEAHIAGPIDKAREKYIPDGSPRLHIEFVSANKQIFQLSNNIC